MDDEVLLELLKKWNQWEKDADTGITRKRYLDRILALIERKEILILKGIRRSGKSTILRQLTKEIIFRGIDRKQILYLNLDEIGFAHQLTTGLFDRVLEVYQKYLGNKGKVYFFIDEIQKIAEWERWIRTMYDRESRFKFIITGSSAALLSQELSTLLTGRNLSITIFPLSFLEYLDFKPGGSIEEYIQFGGFPEVVIENNKETKLLILQQYFEDIIHKDVMDRYEIRNAKQLFDIARYLISVSGSKVSYNKLSHVFGLSKDTLSTYVSYLMNAYLLFEVNYFSFSAKVRHDINKLPKLYCIDVGLVNAVSIKYSKDQGKLIENMVLIKLLEKHSEICYWSELKHEVDFIVDRQAINVTSADIIPERELQGLRAFQEKHNGFSIVLISNSKTEGELISIQDFLTSTQFKA